MIRPPHSGDPQRDALIEEIMTLNDRIHARAMQLFGPIELPEDLTMQQMRVLGVVGHEPGLTGQELSARLSVSAPTASGLVDRLAAKGLVSRAEDPEDRRVRRIELTPAGRQLLSGIDSVFDQLIQAVVPAIALDDLRAIRNGTAAMLHAVEQAVEERG
ncbi:MAG TPA: MarR family transcriptional regulator [Arachnia sp.]|nr:MarR family transcriptional regulator [Arachnia sp.]HMT87377.1 MarR family transcriptional regulator [Arachnia sp.]